MAEANATSSTKDWVWLRKALALAFAALGSMALAEELLREWLAAGKLPWSCMLWKGLDAEGIATLERANRGVLYRCRRDGLFRRWEAIPRRAFDNIPSVAYHEGDPQFWRAGLKIDWEDNGACENAAFGAEALGIKVSRPHLLALLREAPSEQETNGPLPANAQTAAPGANKTYSRSGSQMRRVLPVLKKLYPPNGKAPDDVRTETVRAQVTAELAPDSKMRELAAPSWDTVNRALGRG